MSLYRGVQDPSAVLDWSFDWSAWLAGDTIASSSWDVDGGDGALSIESDGLSDSVTVAVVSGGTVGDTYRLTNTITTAGGLTDQRTILLAVMEQ